MNACFGAEQLTATTGRYWPTAEVRELLLLSQADVTRDLYRLQL
jgi:hypothetical protein